jgi:hypothetical protein
MKVELEQLAKVLTPSEPIHDLTESEKTDEDTAEADEETAETDEASE